MLDLYLENLMKHSLYEFESEAEIIKSIHELHRVFNYTREELEQYPMSEKLVSAYMLLYMSTNMPKLDFVIDQLDEGIRNEILSSEVIDFGSGPGTFAWALQNRDDFKGRTFMVEKSDLMRAQALKLGERFFDHKEWSLHQNLKGLHLKEAPKTLIFGNSVNEISQEEFLEHIDTLKPDHILFIEPGTKEVFSHMLEYQKLLRDKNFDTVYPCPRGTRKCPMERTDNWCHQVLYTVHDQSIERLCQLVKLDRRKQSMTLQVFSKSYKNEDEFFQIRPLRETKFSFDFELCRSIENGKKKNILLEGELLKKSMDKKTQKEMKKITAGAKISFEVAKDHPKKIRLNYLK